MKTEARVTFACPRCGYAANAASALDGSAIAAIPGDVSVCLGCGAPLELAENLAPRWLTFEEVGALPTPLQRELIRGIVGVVTMRPGRVVFTRKTGGPH